VRRLTISVECSNNLQLSLLIHSVRHNGNIANNSFKAMRSTASDGGAHDILAGGSLGCSAPRKVDYFRKPSNLGNLASSALMLKRLPVYDNNTI
jgi:hypothetical protein